MSAPRPPSPESEIPKSNKGIDDIDRTESSPVDDSRFASVMDSGTDEAGRISPDLDLPFKANEVLTDSKKNESLTNIAERTESSPVETDRDAAAEFSYALYLATMPKISAIMTEKRRQSLKPQRPPGSYDAYLAMLPHHHQPMHTETPSDAKSTVPSVPIEQLASYDAYLACMPHFMSNEKPKAGPAAEEAPQPLSYDSYVKLLPKMQAAKSIEAETTAHWLYEGYIATLPSFEIKPKRPPTPDSEIKHEIDRTESSPVEDRHQDPVADPKAPMPPRPPSPDSEVPTHEILKRDVHARTESSPVDEEVAKVMANEKTEAQLEATRVSPDLDLPFKAIDPIKDTPSCEVGGTRSSPVDQAPTVDTAYKLYLATLPKFQSAMKTQKLEPDRIVTYESYLKMIPSFKTLAKAEPSSPDASFGPAANSYEAYLAMIPHFQASQAATAEGKPAAIDRPLAYDSYLKMMPSFKPSSPVPPGAEPKKESAPVSYDSYLAVMPKFMGQTQATPMGPNLPRVESYGTYLMTLPSWQGRAPSPDSEMASISANANVAAAVAMNQSSSSPIDQAMTKAEREEAYSSYLATVSRRPAQPTAGSTTSNAIIDGVSKDGKPLISGITGTAAHPAAAAGDGATAIIDGISKDGKVLISGIRAASAGGKGKALQAMAVKTPTNDRQIVIGITSTGEALVAGIATHASKGIVDIERTESSPVDDARLANMTDGGIDEAGRISPDLDLPFKAKELLTGGKPKTPTDDREIVGCITSSGEALVAGIQRPPSTHTSGCAVVTGVTRDNVPIVQAMTQKSSKQAAEEAYSTYLATLPKFKELVAVAPAAAVASKEPPSYQAYLAMLPKFQPQDTKQPAQTTENVTAAERLASYDTYLSLLPHMTATAKPSAQKPTQAAEPISYDSYLQLMPTFKPSTPAAPAPAPPPEATNLYQSYLATLPSFATPKPAPETKPAAGPQKSTEEVYNSYLATLPQFKKVVAALPERKMSKEVPSYSAYLAMLPSFKSQEAKTTEASEMVAEAERLASYDTYLSLMPHFQEASSTTPDKPVEATQPISYDSYLKLMPTFKTAEPTAKPKPPPEEANLYLAYMATLPAAKKPTPVQSSTAAPTAPTQQMPREQVYNTYLAALPTFKAAVGDKVTSAPNKEPPTYAAYLAMLPKFQPQAGKETTESIQEAERLASYSTYLSLLPHMAAGTQPAPGGKPADASQPISYDSYLMLMPTFHPAGNVEVPTEPPPEAENLYLAYLATLPQMKKPMSTKAQTPTDDREVVGSVTQSGEALIGAIQRPPPTATDSSQVIGCVSRDNVPVIDAQTGALSMYSVTASVKPTPGGKQSAQSATDAAKPPSGQKPGTATQPGSTKPAGMQAQKPAGSTRIVVKRAEGDESPQPKTPPIVTTTNIMMVGNMSETNNIGYDLKAPDIPTPANTPVRVLDDMDDDQRRKRQQQLIDEAAEKAQQLVDEEKSTVINKAQQAAEDVKQSIISNADAAKVAGAGLIGGALGAIGVASQVNKQDKPNDAVKHEKTLPQESSNAEPGLFDKAKAAAQDAGQSAQNQAHDAKQAMDGLFGKAKTAANNASESAQNQAQDAKQAADDLFAKAKTAANDASESAQNQAQDAKEAMGDLFGKAKTAANNASESAQNQAQDAKQAADDLFAKAKTAANDASESAQNQAQDAKEAMGDLFGKTKTAADNAGQTAQNQAHEAKQTAGDLFGKAKTAASDASQSAQNQADDAVKEAKKNGNGLFGKAKTAAGDAKKAVGGLFGAGKQANNGTPAEAEGLVNATTAEGPEPKCDANQTGQSVTIEAKDSKFFGGFGSTKPGANETTKSIEYQAQQETTGIGNQKATDSSNRGAKEQAKQLGAELLQQAKESKDTVVSQGKRAVESVNLTFERTGGSAPKEDSKKQVESVDLHFEKIPSSSRDESKLPTTGEVHGWEAPAPTGTTNPPQSTTTTDGKDRANGLAPFPVDEVVGGEPFGTDENRQSRTWPRHGRIEPPPEDSQRRAASEGREVVPKISSFRRLRERIRQYCTIL